MDCTGAAQPLTRSWVVANFSKGCEESQHENHSIDALCKGDVVGSLILCEEDAPNFAMAEVTMIATRVLARVNKKLCHQKV